MGRNENNDAIWQSIRKDVEEAAANEPLLASFLHSTVLRYESLSQSLTLILATKLGRDMVPSVQLREVFQSQINESEYLQKALIEDLVAVRERDPACHSYSLPLLYFKGFQALQACRINHSLWENGHRGLAYYLQNRISEVFGVDIHPAAKMGSGIMFDHATGIVVGETAIIGDNVSMLHSVTLGGTGKDSGDRHPKIGNQVLLGAGSKLLGNIQIGECVRVAAGSVVLEDVPANTTVAGVPAKIVKIHDDCNPAGEMDQSLE